MALNSKTEGSGEPLLLIHGIISDHTFFDGLSACLKGRYQTIVYDRRGYGAGNGQAYTDFSVAAQAEDAAEIIREYAGSSVWVFGNSAGGLIGLELLLRYPELVKGLIMMEPSLVFNERSRIALEAWNRELNEIRDSGRYKKALPAFSGMTGEKAVSGTSTNSTSALDEMKKTYSNLKTFLEGELNEVQNYRPTKDALQSIQKPISVAVTEEGKDYPFGFSSYDAANILGWDILWLPGKHQTVLTHTKETAELLDKKINEMRQACR